MIYFPRWAYKGLFFQKVMGATVAQVVGLLSWDFVKLLGLAALIALPVGYGLGLVLLSNFAYRVSIGLETLGVCVAMLLVVGGATVGWRTYRAALATTSSTACGPNKVSDYWLQR